MLQRDMAALNSGVPPASGYSGGGRGAITNAAVFDTAVHTHEPPQIHEKAKTGHHKCVPDDGSSFQPGTET